MFAREKDTYLNSFEEKYTCNPKNVEVFFPSQILPKVGIKYYEQFIAAVPKSKLLN